MSFQKLSIIIPLYNEKNTIFKVLEKIQQVHINGMSKEMIIINDGSTDSSELEVIAFIKKFPSAAIQYISHKNNKGKGASISTGLTHATGEYVLIQDADLEYDPSNYNLLIDRVIKTEANVVYGSRFLADSSIINMSLKSKIANKILTSFYNSFNVLQISDLETGFKLFKTDILKSIHLQEQRFGFEPEVTAKLSRVENLKFEEVGISYQSRTYKEGKKIKWQDGFKALYCILKYNIQNNLN